MEIESTRRPPNIIANRKNVQHVQSLTEAGATDADEKIVRSIAKGDSGKDSTKLNDLLGGAGAGGVSLASLEMFKIGNNVNRSELVTLFKEHNFTPGASEQLADHTLQTVRSAAGKSIFAGLAVGSAAYGILEVVKPDWVLKKKVFWSVGTAVLAALLYLTMVKLGYMQ